MQPRFHVRELMPVVIRTPFSDSLVHQLQALPHVARDCSALAMLVAERGKSDDARQFMRRAWTIRAAKYGSHDKRTTACHNWLVKHDPTFTAERLQP